MNWLVAAGLFALAVTSAYAQEAQPPAAPTIEQLAARVDMTRVRALAVQGEFHQAYSQLLEARLAEAARREAALAEWWSAYVAGLGATGR